jgi:four helix bundle protein
MSLQGLERLEAWKKAKDFAVKICKDIVPLLPPTEEYALKQQLRRASQSIAANIAEGYGRYYYQETIRFCYIARGSLDETLSHLVIAHELGYIPKDVYSRLIQDGDEISRIVNGYVSFLKKSKRGENEPGAHSIREISESYNVDSLEMPDDNHEITD